MSKEAFATELRNSGCDPQAGTIRNIPISIEITNDKTLGDFQDRVPAGIFLMDPFLENDLNSIIEYGIKHHVVVYSPFKGDVEQGVFAGLSIEARVRPYINLNTMRSSQISVKPFFLKVAKLYEQ